MNYQEPIDSAFLPLSGGYEPELAMWMPPTTEELQQLLPQFEVLELIAYGGMGAVYKARQLSLDRLVAIKILPPHALDDGPIDYVERFKNEARMMARLNHPDIVTVYDFDETIEGHLYFIMEFVDGTDVSKMIESQGRLTPEYALAITAHVCDALHYAHSQGVIHRDIKPGNVLINMEGEVKVADFGIAKVGGNQSGGIAEENMTLGTPDFIAPEALMMGVEVDHRADLYSLGVMLYKMLTGALPQGEYHPASQLAGSDARYDAIIACALQYDPEHRYQSAWEIRRDLDDIINTPVVKEGNATVRAAIPKQFVHRRAIQAPVFRRPVASHYIASKYNTGPIPRNYTALFSFITVVAMLAVGVFVWRNEIQSMVSSAGYQPELMAQSKKNPATKQHLPAAREKAASMFDVTDAFKPPTGPKMSLVHDNF